jgi:hypothetical protein
LPVKQWPGKWTAAAARAGNRHKPRPCASEQCAAGRLERWMRRDNGVYLNDRWYCGGACAQSALLEVLAGAPRSSPASRPRAHRLPLGLLMLSRGVIDEEQLKAALNAQGEAPELRIGECLVRLGAVKGEDITRALGAQHSLPVLVAFEPEPDHGIPLTLLEASRCVAFRGSYQQGIVYVGFAGSIDRSLLNAAEAVLGALCEPCIVDSHTIEEHLAARRQLKNDNEVVFETRNSAQEIVRSVQSYVEQARAEMMRVAATREYFWVKLQGTRQLDLLFRTA